MGGTHTSEVFVFRPYLFLLRTPGAALPFLATFAGALPIGMLGLAVLLLVRTATGSFSAAGLTAGALSAGNAAGLALQGRLIDRYGQTWVLLGAGVVSSGALVVLTVATTTQGSLAVGLVLAAVAGAGIPATTTSMRVLIPVLVPDPLTRRAAYALLAIQFQLALVAGPLVVAVLVELARPATAVLGAGVLCAVAAAGFAVTPASRTWRPAPARRQVWWPRGLASPGMRTLLAGAAAAGLAAGLVGVGVPAVALADGTAALAGLMFAASSAGDVLGGMAYGGRRWRLPVRLQLVGAQAGMAVCAVGLVALTDLPAAMVPVMFLAGTLNAPAGIATSTLLDHHAPSGALAESYTLVVAAGLVAISAGNALGGVLATAAGPRSLFVVAALGSAAVAVLTYVRRNTLAPS